MYSKLLQITDARTREKRDMDSGQLLANIQATLDEVTRESEEKSLLLGELRHRMKNNLQTIQSLLRVKKAHSHSADSQKELAHIEILIAALNGVDGELLVAEERRPIALGKYLRRLAGKLKDVFGNISAPVSFRLELNEVEVPAKAAANIGLFVNEAITNSFKHAVPNGATVIGLTLIREDGVATVTISDNGPGFDVHQRSHIGGTLLMKRLAERLKTSVQCDTDSSGTRYIIRLPIQDNDSAGRAL